MTGPGEGGALKNISFFFVSDKSFHPERDDDDACVAIRFDHAFESGGTVKIHMSAAKLDFIQANFADFFCHLGVLLGLPETMALNSKIERVTHDDVGKVI